MESVEYLSKHNKGYIYTAVELFNTMFGKFEKRFRKDDQTFSFSHTRNYDPDTFAWPLVPPDGWESKTMFDNQFAIGGHVLATNNIIGRVHNFQGRLGLRAVAPASRGLIPTTAPYVSATYVTPDYFTAETAHYT